MQIEYEAKFLEINASDIRTKLCALGAKCIHERVLMKRVLFDHPNFKNAFIRIRDEGNGITMTGKRIFDHNVVDGVSEVEIKVSDFNNAKEFINFLGIPTRSYQETYRELWQFGEIIFSIDEWPGIKPFLEIEWPNEEIVNGICLQLELDISTACFWAVDTIYEKILWISKEEFNNFKLVTFDNPPSTKNAIV